MKEIVNVNIAGVSFSLDGDAYTILDEYLEKLRARYSKVSDGAEIMEDIESRIAEIILSHQASDETVVTATIQIVIEQLGKPEDITEDVKNDGNDDEAPKKSEKIARRLYRNPDNSKIGGVCSGLSAYFNIDVTLVRILFLAPLILLALTSILDIHHIGYWKAGNLWGTFVLLYIALCIVIPKAKTPLQKMEMCGEKITTDKIEKSFRESFSNMERNISEKPSPRSQKNASVFAEIVSVLGRIILFGIKFFVAFIGIIIAIVVVSILIAIIYVMTNPQDIGLFNFGEIPSTAFSLIAVIIIIPLAILGYMLIRAVYGTKQRKGVVSTLGVIWIITVIFGTVICIKDFDKISNFIYDAERQHEVIDDMEDSIDSRTDLVINGKTLYIEQIDSTDVSEDSVKIFPVKLRVGDDDFAKPTIVVKKSYKNIERDMAKGKVKEMNVDYFVRNDTLFVRPYVSKIKSVSRQAVEFNVYLPDSISYVVGSGIGYNEYLED